MATKEKDKNVIKPKKESNPLSNVNTSKPVTENRFFDLIITVDKQDDEGQEEE